MNLGNEKKGKIIIGGLFLYYCLEGTQAKDTKFVYNDVKNITKESVKLHNSYRSSSSRGINAGATIGYGHKIQTTGNGGSISASRSNRNTDETIHANGNFSNVNEVHNNTGTMTLSGFNQEGGKVTGNIGKVEVISRQNTSTTTGSSKGVNLGISANGGPSSVTINASRTNGDRAFVDNQSTFVVGEGSNLHVGTVENTGAIIGKEGNSTFKIDTYAGKDIQNYDTMTTTGGSIGASLGGKPKITNVGFNQDSRDKQGITRNTVVGDVEIGESFGSPINRDLGKANEVTKDTHSSTNINVEPQVIEYLTNPGKLKEDIGKAKEEINDIKWAIKESIHDRGDDNRNFFGQLSEVRLDKSLENITGERLIGKTVDTEIAGIFKDAYKDLGYDINIIFSDPKNSPQLLDEKGKPKTGTAYVRDEKGKKIKTIIINGEDPKNATKAGLIGTIVEEGSHVIGKVEGRQRKTGTDEKGLESTGRASNEYFSEKYKDDNPAISIHSDGKDYSNVDFGEHVGDEAVTIGVISIVVIAGVYVVYQAGKPVGRYLDLDTAKKNAKLLSSSIGGVFDLGRKGIAKGIDYGANAANKIGNWIGGNSSSKAKSQSKSVQWTKATVRKSETVSNKVNSNVKNKSRSDSNSNRNKNKNKKDNKKKNRSNKNSKNSGKNNTNGNNRNTGQSGNNVPGPDYIPKGDPESNYDNLPENVKESYEEHSKNSWSNKYPDENNNGDITYRNDGRRGGEVLPKTDANGNPIEYTEHDVNPRPSSGNRDSLRFVRGSDGKTYMTDDHYRTFKEIKPEEIVPKEITPSD